VSEPEIGEGGDRLGPAGRGLLGALAVALAACALAGGVILGTGLLADDDDAEAPIVAPAEVAEAARARTPAATAGDPFAYSRERRADFVERATLGSSHVLYEKSPGGAPASAERTARWRPLIERAAAEHGTDPDLMEAMVLLESAGRPEVIAGDDPEAASGLAQIIPSTATDLLGMRVDLEASKALTAEYAANARRIARARVEASASADPKASRRAVAQVRDLTKRNREVLRERRAIDERFDPEVAIDRMGRYLAISEARFGRVDLAVVSYHMGIGNLENLIGRYVGAGASGRPVGAVVSAEDLDYPQLFFDSSPLRNPRAWSFLASLGDDSSTYLWRVLAAERIMRLHREDPGRLDRIAELQTAKASAEEVFHPEDETTVFEDPAALEDAAADGDLVPLPGEAEAAGYGFRVGDQLGELAKDLGISRQSYRALRPEALAALIYLSARVREINGGKGKLIVTSAVRDRAYQEALVGVNPEATPAYSLHTTGYSFDILRRYSNDRQAEAFQFTLDRLRALAVIDYAVEPQAIHITVSDGAKPLLQE